MGLTFINGAAPEFKDNDDILNIVLDAHWKQLNDQYCNKDLYPDDQAAVNNYSNGQYKIMAIFFDKYLEKIDNVK